MPCMWNLPGPGIEPVSPALAGRFLTTVSPGNSYIHMGGTKYNIFCEYIFELLWVAKERGLESNSIRSTYLDDKNQSRTFERAVSKTQLKVSYEVSPFI